MILNNEDDNNGNNKLENEDSDGDENSNETNNGLNEYNQNKNFKSTTLVLKPHRTTQRFYNCLIFTLNL